MWAFYFLLVLAHCQLQCHVQGARSAPTFGVNWGIIASHPLDPPIVANMLKDNGIEKVKLFDTDSWTMSCLAGTNIELMVGIPNDFLGNLAGKAKHARKWVKHNVAKHVDGGVNIRYVSVGNEPFLKSYNGSFVTTTLPAMQNIQNAIDEAGLGDTIKVTTALNADVYTSSSDKPSGGVFRPDILDLMKQIVQFLDSRNSPFVVNIYPFLALYQNDNFPQDFAFFDGDSAGSFDDVNAHYSNVFDANFDTLVWALRKIGFPNMNIVIGEIGWPTDGNKHATVDNAKRFYQGFSNKMASGKGTPLRPGPITAYLFSLLDEDQKSIAPGNFERHWGIFRYDGKPKFPVDFSSEGKENKWPIGAKGVQYQDPKWCVLKPTNNIVNISNLPSALSYACAGGDCTSLGFGCSCANLNESGNASYAFNQFFQINDQNVDACDFGGMANIVSNDPSRGNCSFPIEIISGGNMLKAPLKVGGIFIALIIVTIL